jgi:hypothetical protein
MESGLDPMDVPFVRKRVEPFGIPAPSPLDCFVICGGNLSLLMSATAFLWPSFARVGGVTVRASERIAHQDVAEWMKSLDGDRAAVERMINHVHLHDLIASTIPAEDEFPDAQARPLTQAIARSWTAALAFAFPGSTFHVEAFDGEEHGGPHWTDPTLTFWEAR